jgi:hypothetical protein
MKERGLAPRGTPQWVGLTLAVLTSITTKEAPVSESYSGRQFVGIDLHRRRSVIARLTADGDPLECIQISNEGP